MFVLTKDPETDAWYLKLREAEIVQTKQLDSRVLCDLDSEGNVVGIEVLGS